MKIFFLYINTVKYLRFKQIFYRILRPLVRPSYPKKIKLIVLKVQKSGTQKIYMKKKYQKATLLIF